METGGAAKKETRDPDEQISQYYPSTKKNIGKIPRLRLSLYIAAAAAKV